MLRNFSNFLTKVSELENLIDVDMKSQLDMKMFIWQMLLNVSLVTCSRTMSGHEIVETPQLLNERAE